MINDGPIIQWLSSFLNFSWHWSDTLLLHERGSFRVLYFSHIDISATLVITYSMLGNTVTTNSSVINYVLCGLEAELLFSDSDYLTTALPLHSLSVGTLRYRILKDGGKLPKYNRYVCNKALLFYVLTAFISSHRLRVQPAPQICPSLFRLGYELQTCWLLACLLNWVNNHIKFILC